MLFTDYSDNYTDEDLEMLEYEFYHLNNANAVGNESHKPHSGMSKFDFKHSIFEKYADSFPENFMHFRMSDDFCYIEPISGCRRDSIITVNKKKYITRHTSVNKIPLNAFLHLEEVLFLLKNTSDLYNYMGKTYINHHKKLTDKFNKVNNKKITKYTASLVLNKLPEELINMIISFL